MRRIGVLMNIAADDPEAQSRMIAFVQALAQLGWMTGRNVKIEFWSASKWIGSKLRRTQPEHILIAVGTRVTSRPPHRTVRAPFGHTAPTLGV